MTMTNDQRYAMQQLSIIFQENLGSKLTVALANGMLHQLEQVLQAKPASPMDNVSSSDQPQPPTP